MPILSATVRSCKLLSKKQGEEMEKIEFAIRPSALHSALYF